MTQLGQQIRTARKELGWTLTDLAGRAGVDPGDLSRIENGKTDPRFSTAARLLDALDIKIVPTGRAARPALSETSRLAARRSAGRLTPAGQADRKLALRA